MRTVRLMARGPAFIFGLKISVSVQNCRVQNKRCRDVQVPVVQNVLYLRSRLQVKTAP